MAVKKKSKSSKKPKWHFDDHPLVAKLRAADALGKTQLLVGYAARTDDPTEVQIFLDPSCTGSVTYKLSDLVHTAVAASTLSETLFWIHADAKPLRKDGLDDARFRALVDGAPDVAAKLYNAGKTAVLGTPTITTCRPLC